MLICSFRVAAQQKDSINQLDKNGKKHGYWLVYLDEKKRPVEKEKASFYAYDHYDHGAELFIFSKTKWKENGRIEYDQPLPQSGSPVLLNGTFKWYDENNRLISDQTFVNGTPTHFHEYEPLHGRNDTVFMTEDIDFTLRYHNTPGTYQLTEYYQNGNTERSLFRKGKKGWKFYHCKNLYCWEDEILYVHDSKTGKTDAISGDLDIKVDLMTDEKNFTQSQPFRYQGQVLNVEGNTFTLVIHEEITLTQTQDGSCKKQKREFMLTDSLRKRPRYETRVVNSEDIKSLGYVQRTTVSNIGAAIASTALFAALVVAPFTAYDFKTGDFNNPKYEKSLIQYAPLFVAGVAVNFAFRKSRHFTNGAPGTKNFKRFSFSDKK